MIHPTRTHPGGRPLLAAAAALLLAGCAGQRAASPFGGSAGVIEIEVQNDNFADATLHALREGRRIRLGIVNGKGSRTFQLDWRSSQPLRIEIDLLAGGRCVTELLQVDPGDEFYLQIESQLGTMAACRAP